MKLSISFTSLMPLLLLVGSTQAVTSEISFTDTCNFDNVKAAVAAEGEDILTLLGVSDEDQATVIIESLCAKAIADNSDEEIGAYAFEDITGAGWQFDSNFYDGGTYLNEEYEPEEIPAFIDEVYNNVAQQNLITYPEEHLSKNFADCQAQSVMCCWVQDRQANDNNGNCADDDCKNADPADNTDICYMDLDIATGSNHVAGGFAIYDGESEGDAHCHGFAWSNDEDSTSYRYRGNTLFYVSMYDHLSERGYVREVPGAPMCSCLEQMPAVSESDCTEMDIQETYVINFDTLTASISNVDIDFNACTNNELRDRFDEIHAAGDATDAEKEVFDQFIVGDCDTVTESFLNSKGFATA